MNIPARIISGDTIEWTEQASADRGSAEFTLTYAIRGAVNLTVTGVAAGSGWNVTITSTQSATLTAGTYTWQAYLTSGSVRYTVGTGTLIVDPNITAQSAGYDGRTQAEVDLAAVKQEIRARTTGGMTIEYTIGTRSLKKESISRLLELKSALEADVARERQAKRLSDGLGRGIFVRFGR